MVFQKLGLNLVFLFCFLLYSLDCFAQDNQPVKKNDFERFEIDLKNDRISSAQYIDSIEKLVNLEFSKGVTFETNELLKKLETYRNIAFETEKNEDYRGKYFTILANNALFRNRVGEAVFYLEKSVKEGKSPDIQKLNVLSTKCRFYTDNSLYKQAADVYEKDSVLVNKVISSILNDTAKDQENINIFYLLSFISNTYANLYESAKNYQIIEVSQKLKSKYLKKTHKNKETIPVINFFVSAMEYYQAELADSDFTKAAQILKQMQHDLDTETQLQPEWRVMLQANIDNMKTSHFLQTKQNDSARFYIAKQQKGSVIFETIKLNNDKNMAQLYENEQDFKNAYQYLQNAFKTKEKIHTQTIDETNNLLYAYTDSEFNKNELIKAEIKNKNRAISIIIIIFGSVISILIIYFLSWRKQKIAENRIEQMANITKLQIAEMEETKFQAVKEEQMRLGQDLHDSLASSIASIKNRIELVLLDITDEKAKHSLESIYTQTQNTYAAVRDKSHKWFNNGREQLELHFAERIKNIADSAMPDISYKKEIYIDNEVVELLNIETRIEILKIVQESIANIIKHTKADTVSIVMYQEGNEILLSVKDNGKGFKEEKFLGKKSNLGIVSMKNRAQNFGGKINITSGSSGTEINLSITLKTV